MTERSTRKTGFFLEFFIFQTEPFRWKTAFIIQGIFFFLRLDTVTTAVGWKNELASLIGSFNPSWDEDGGTDEAFFRAVSVAGMILDNKFARYLGNERADKRIEEILETQNPEADSRILVLPEFIPCQKRLSETDI